MAIIDLDQTHPERIGPHPELLRRNRIEWVRREYPDIGICRDTSWSRWHVPRCVGRRPDQRGIHIFTTAGWWRGGPDPPHNPPPWGPRRPRDDRKPLRRHRWSESGHPTNPSRER